MLDEVRAIGVHKPGAVFVSDEHGKSLPFDFTNALNTSHDYSFQVKRAELDQILFRNAARRGAVTMEGVRVREVEPGSPSLVRAEGPDGPLQWRARFVVDASGRDAFLARKQGIQTANKRNNNAAVFSHFEGVAPLGEVETGHIAIHLFDHGWFWVIPLTNGITSIGVVGPLSFFRDLKGDHDGFLRDAIRRSPSLTRRTAGARMVMPAVATGNYSYAASRMVSDAHILVGDAFAFIDPVFSSGVLLGMQSAAAGAEAVDAWLTDPAKAAPLFQAFEEKVRGSLREFSWLIYRINDPTMRDLFMSPSNRFKMQDGVISILGGNAHANEAAKVPILAFKGAFYLFSLLRHLGWRLRDGRLVRETALPATPPHLAAHA